MRPTTNHDFQKEIQNLWYLKENQLKKWFLNDLLFDIIEKFIFEKDREHHSVTKSK